MGLINWLLGANGIPEDVSSVVYRRLHGMVRIMSSDEELDYSLTRLSELRVKVKQMTDRHARAAYLYWIPYFEDQARRYKEMNAHQRAVRRIEDKVPRP